MLAPLSWLKDFAPFPDDIALLRSTLDDLGLVVEGVEIVGEGLNDVIVAKVSTISAIEGADRIRHVVVDDGSGSVEIVCGAMNFVEGDLVPLAPVGAILPGNFTIASRKMKGVTSNGMLCSGKELGLGDDHDGLMILTDVPGAEPGSSLVKLLEIAPDVIFDVTVEGNRPDAWSISGLARDLAARLGLAFTPVTPVPPAASGPSTSELASGEVINEELCSRLGVGVLSNVVVGPSPQLIAQRLTKAGMRPINNVVDASNYVMLELGQPTHPYDLDKIEGKGLRVRTATTGESLVTLDGVTRELGVAGRSLGDTGQDLVICDANDTVVGIAGIMGGESSEISGETSSVLLEAARFDPITITRTSRRFALRSEAAARFQKGTDPGILERAIDRFAEILGHSSPGLVVAPSKIMIPATPVESVSLDVPLSRVNGLLGTQFQDADIAGLLEPLGFTVDVKDSDVLVVSVPTNRPDIRATHHGIADVIEEIARTYGYSRLPRRVLAWPQPGARNPRQSFRSQLRDVFIGNGSSEAWTSSLVGEGELEKLGLSESEITVSNPLTIDESRLRRSLIPGLVRSIGFNADRRQEDISLFEIGATFLHPDGEQAGRVARAGSLGSHDVHLPYEQECAVLLSAREDDDARSAVGIFHMVASALRLQDVRIRTAPSGTPELAGLHPTRSALLRDQSTNEIVGALGEVDPSLVGELAPGAKEQRIAALVLFLDVLGDPHRCLRHDEIARTPSRFPSADLDFAFVVSDEIPSDAIEDALRLGAGDLLEDVHLFDVYRGTGVTEGARSLAYRVRLSSSTATLSDDDIGSARTSMISAAQSAGAILR